MPSKPATRTTSQTMCFTPLELFGTKLEDGMSLSPYFDRIDTLKKKMRISP